MLLLPGNASIRLALSGVASHPVHPERNWWKDEFTVRRLAIKLPTLLGGPGAGNQPEDIRFGDNPDQPSVIHYR